MHVNLSTFIGVNFARKAGDHGESEARAYNGGLGQSPQWGPGSSPWSGGQ